MAYDIVSEAKPLDDSVIVGPIGRVATGTERKKGDGWGADEVHTVVINMSCLSILIMSSWGHFNSHNFKDWSFYHSFSTIIN